GVDHQIVVATVNPDDHAFVQGLLGRHEHAAAVLQLPQGIGHGIAVVLADEHAVAALAHTAFAHGSIVVENVTHQAGTTREGEDLTLEADEATRRNAVFQTGAAAAVGHHVQ